MRRCLILSCTAMLFASSGANAQDDAQQGAPSETPIEKIIRAETLAEKGETRRDSRLLVAAACASADAGQILSVALSDSGEMQKPSKADPLEPVALLERADRLKTNQTRALVEAAREAWRKGSFLQDACGFADQDQLRGTTALFRASGRFKRGERRRVMLPEVNPSEPLHIVARADVYGRIAIRLIDARGAAICQSANKPDREVRCSGMTPNARRPLAGYAVEVENASSLDSWVKIYAN